MRSSLVFALSVLLFACGDSTGTGGSGGSGGAGVGGDDHIGGASVGGESAGGTAPGGGDAGGSDAGGASCVDTSELTYGPGPTGEPACLDVPSANVFCGFGSDEAICNFSVGCGHSRDLGQCQINCEQGSSSFCNDEAAVDCVVDAFCADDCTALEACTFIL